MENLKMIENEIMLLESKLSNIKNVIELTKEYGIFKNFILDIISNDDVIIKKCRIFNAFKFIKRKTYIHYPNKLEYIDKILFTYYPNENKFAILYSNMWKPIKNKFNYDNKVIKELLENILSEYFELEKINLILTTYKTSKEYLKIQEELK